MKAVIWREQSLLSTGTSLSRAQLPKYQLCHLTLNHSYPCSAVSDEIFHSCLQGSKELVLHLLSPPLPSARCFTTITRLVSQARRNFLPWYVRYPLTVPIILVLPDCLFHSVQVLFRFPVATKPDGQSGWQSMARPAQCLRAPIPTLTKIQSVFRGSNKSTHTKYKQRIRLKILSLVYFL